MGFNSKVRVTFIDDSTGKAFGVTEMPPSDLPESFEIDTTLHIGKDNWSVVDAQPNNRSEYAKSKSLTLRLLRVELMDPNKILFSLPSICDVIPGLSDQVLSGDELVIAEDDWRQFELVSNNLGNEVDAEIEKIRVIHANESEGIGWRKLHLRSKPDCPLNCVLSLEALEDRLNLGVAKVGVAYRGARSPIVDGFAFCGSALTVYGVAPSGCVKTLAFGPDLAVPLDAHLIEHLKMLCRDLSLDLVNWYRCARVPPESANFEVLFSSDKT